MTVVRFKNGVEADVDFNNPDHQAWVEQMAASVGEEGPLGLGGQLGRQAQLMARSTIKAGLLLPGIVNDALGGIYNTAANAIQGEGQGFRFKQTQEAVNDLWRRAGGAEPVTSTEKLVDVGVQGMVGGAPFARLAGAAGQLPAITQTVSNATAPMAAEWGRQRGFGPWAQAGLGIAGGAIPPLAVAAGQGAGRAASHIFGPLRQGSQETPRWRQLLGLREGGTGRERVKQEIVAELVKGRKHEVIDALDENAQFVPGTRNTAATAAAPAGSAELAGAEKTLSTKFIPSRAAELEKANEAARVAQVEKVSSLPGVRQAVAEAQGVASDINYAKALKVDVKPDGKLWDILKDPFIKKAMPEADKLIKAKVLETGKDITLTEKLDLLKKALDGVIEATGENAISKAAKGAAVRAQTRLLGWLDAKNPTYAEARQMHAGFARAIDRMDYGQYMKDKLVSPLETTQRPTAFAQAQRDAAGSIKRAVGQGPFKPSPQDVQTLGTVQQDLSREALVNQLANKGTTAARDIMGTALTTLEPPGFLHRPTMLLRAGLERVQKGVSGKVLSELALDLQDPNKVARMLENANPRERLSLLLAYQHLKDMTRASMIPTTAQITGESE